MVNVTLPDAAREDSAESGGDSERYEHEGDEGPVEPPVTERGVETDGARRRRSGRRDHGEGGEGAGRHARYTDT